ncbi:MAG: BON domain-containing protein [Terracidiphilus sp.]|nr:BON domain-containing protein [Terracidiphilus sp.]MDR3777093.1 BON domain-containing protein [Terracidiphilus sp.]
MKRPFLKRVFPQVLVWTAVVALYGATALAQDAAPSQRSDGQIEMDVVHALDASPVLKNDLITAATIQSEVTLSGTVASASSKELAESISSHVAGVTKVHNNLKVGNPQDVPDQTGAYAGDQQMADSQADDASQPAFQQQPTAQPDYGQQQAQAPAQQYPQAQQYPAAQPYPNDQPYPAAQPYPSNQPYPGNQPYPPARPQYAPAPPPLPNYEAPRGPVTIPPGTLLQVRTNEPVGTKFAKEGTPVQFTVIQDVAFGGVLAIPRGATAHGVVTEIRKNGDLGGSAELALRLTGLDLGGQSYALESDQFKVKGPNKAERTVSNALGGALLGAIIGGAAGRGEGAAIGAGVGAAAGTAASAATPGPGVWIPAEALVDFHLTIPVTVNPVSLQEASRLAQGLYPGGPTLYRRPYARPYYAYPPVYYRPYYTVGGYYYWR